MLPRAIWHVKLASARLDSVGVPVLMKCLGGVVTGYVCGRVWACVGVTTLANHLGYVFATPAEVEVTEILGDFMAVTRARPDGDEAGEMDNSDDDSENKGKSGSSTSGSASSDSSPASTPPKVRF